MMNRIFAVLVAAALVAADRSLEEVTGIAPAVEPVEAAIAHLPRVDVTAEVADTIANGRVLPRWDGAGPWALFGPDGRLLAVYEAFRGDEANVHVRQKAG